MCFCSCSLPPRLSQLQFTFFAPFLCSARRSFHAKWRKEGNKPHLTDTHTHSLKWARTNEQTIQCCFVAFCKREHTRFAYKYVFGLWLVRCPAAPTCPCAYYLPCSPNSSKMRMCFISFCFFFSRVGNISLSRALSCSLWGKTTLPVPWRPCVRTGKRQFYWNANRKMHTVFIRSRWQLISLHRT